MKKNIVFICTIISTINLYSSDKNQETNFYSATIAGTLIGAKVGSVLRQKIAHYIVNKSQLHIQLKLIALGLAWPMTFGDAVQGCISGLIVDDIRKKSWLLEQNKLKKLEQSNFLKHSRRDLETYLYLEYLKGKK